MHEHSYVIERIFFVVVITQLVAYQKKSNAFVALQNVHAENWLKSSYSAVTSNFLTSQQVLVRQIDSGWRWSQKLDNVISSKSA
jgi:hypothetical protein